MAGVDGRGKQSTTRRRTWFAVALGIAGIIAAMAKLCFFTVETGEHALVTEFGKPVQVITAPGLGFKYPYQNVRTFDSRLFAYTPASTEFLISKKRRSSLQAQSSGVSATPRSSSRPSSTAPEPNRDSATSCLPNLVRQSGEVLSLPLFRSSPKSCGRKRFLPR